MTFKRFLIGQFTGLGQIYHTSIHNLYTVYKTHLFKMKKLLYIKK